MPSGDMRRPPQIWEQRLAGRVSAVSLGVDSVAQATVRSDDSASTSYTEPEDTVFGLGTPSTPTLVKAVQSIAVNWDGKDTDGDAYNGQTQWVEVHMSAGTFTAGTATLKGQMDRPGAWVVSGLTAGTTYYAALVGVDVQGNRSTQSAYATAVPGLTTTSDYGTATIGTAAVSFNARTIGGLTNTVGSATPTSPLTGDVWLDTTPGTAVIHKVYNGSTWVTNAWGSASIAAGQITALQIAAGAITAGAIAADAITGKTVTGGTVTGSYITGGTIAGALVSGNTITGGTVSASYISGGTINGATITSASISGYQTAGTYLTPTDVGPAGATTISGSRITTGVLNADLITAGTVSGRTVQSASSGKRIILDSANNALYFNQGGVGASNIEVAPVSSRSTYGVTIGGCIDSSSFIEASGNIYVGSKVRPASGTADLYLMAGTTSSADTGYLNCQNVYDYTTATAANVVSGSNGRLIRSTSSARYKTNLVEVMNHLTGVDPAKIADPLTEGAVDPFDVLDLAPTQFQALGPDGQDPVTDGRAYLGFISEDVAAKFPIAAEWNADGQPESYDVRGIVAALLAVAVQQQATIADLTARIEALEG